MGALAGTHDSNAILQVAGIGCGEAAVPAEPSLSSVWRLNSVGGLVGERAGLLKAIDKQAGGAGQVHEGLGATGRMSLGVGQRALPLEVSHCSWMATQ